MGGFYGNITLRGPSQSRVVAALRGRRAAVAPGESKFTVVFDSSCDDHDVDAIRALASGLSRRFRCPALAVIVHDDDVLGYVLYCHGKLADSYNSNPSYFDFGARRKSAGAQGGDSKALCEAFRVDCQEEVEKILRQRAGKRGYVFETERHRDLVSALGLPALAIGKALASFERAEYPAGLSAAQIMWAADPPPVVSQEEKWDREFYDRLGAENAKRPCKRQGCGHGAIPMSVLCKRHHFAMVQGRDCPF